MLETIGWTPDVARAAAGCNLAGHGSVGRVARVDRGLVWLLTATGPRRVSLGGAVLAAMAADPLSGPCTGDWVVVEDWSDSRSTVERVLPRRTAVVRAVAGKQSHGQVLCTNVDLVALVVALHPLPVLAKVERLVALAWQSGARPVVVLTKADLVTDAEQVARDVAAAAPGVEVLVASGRTGEGVTALRALVEGRLTLALVGASGHGKSTLTNALVGAEVLRTRAIRADGRGRHTSVRRELVPLPGGGAVIDTPGLRGVGLTAVGPSSAGVDGAGPPAEEGLATAFSDVEGFAARCRFGDCAHESEPGCAVARAVVDGDLSVRRVESWLHLRRELRWAASRAEASSRAGRGKQRRRRTPEAGRG